MGIYLNFGATKPTGWLQARMRRDLNGFVGNLDKLVPDLITDDDIYFKNRLSRSTKAKNVGAILDSDDPAATEQFFWWNSETQSNWRDGWLRHVLLVGNADEKVLVENYINRILDTADPDGYLGIYAPDLRFKQTGENGELWAQATLGRSLLGYIESHLNTENGQTAFSALIRSVDLTIENYLNVESNLFSFSSGGGGAHGLMYVDVLDALHRLTGDSKYQVVAAKLHEAYVKSDASEPDIIRKTLQNTEAKFRGHGVHTYEHLRSIVIASAGNTYSKAATDLAAYLEKLPSYLTPAGGPIGDEWISEKTADASTTGYEFCSTVELMDSLIRLMIQTESFEYAESIENLCFNAGLGAWHPDFPAIAYLQTDNAYEMSGNRFGAEPDDHQTRYRYSSVHRQAAVCCVPNAGRLLPNFLRGLVFQSNEELFIASFVPSNTKIDLKEGRIDIQISSDYPYGNTAVIQINNVESHDVVINLRKPNWAKHLELTFDSAEIISESESAFKLRIPGPSTTLNIDFKPEIEIRFLEKNEVCITRGPLVYAASIPSQPHVTHSYEVAGFMDLAELPVIPNQFPVTLTADFANEMTIESDRIYLPALTANTENSILLELAPLGKSALRQATFRVQDES